MIRRLHTITIAALAIGAAVWVGVQAVRPARVASKSAIVRDASTLDLGEAPFIERAQRDTQIAVWHIALAADSESALALGVLSALHLQRAREGGGWNDYLEAESLARRSLALREQRNSSTFATLTASLVAQHRFSEAEAIATDLVTREPDVLEYRAILAEVAMERGDYVTAGREFVKVWPLRGSLSVAPRLARWYELNGWMSSSRRILEAARATALSRRDVPVEVKAWFGLRLGEFERRAGRPRHAEAAFREGLALEPNDPRLLAAMTRLSASADKHDDVILWGERAQAAQLDPEVIVLLADAYDAKGDTAQAHQLRAAFDVAVSTTSGPFHRQWSMALLDHGERVSQELVRAQHALRDRQDVYGYDLVAWALYKSGRVEEASVAMERAMQLGSRDPLLREHQSAINQALLAAAPVERGAPTHATAGARSGER